MKPGSHRTRSLVAGSIALCTVAAVLPSTPVRAGSVPAISVSGLATHVPQWTMLRGSLTPGLNRAGRGSALAGTRRLTVTVTLQFRNRAALTQLIADEYNPSSPGYRRFISAAQFKAEFAPTAATQARVGAWLHSEGFQVGAIASNGLTLRARGSVHTIQRAFHTTLAAYRLQSRSFFANNSPLRIPGALASDLTAVSGLSNEAQVAPVGSHVVSHLGGGIRGNTAADLAAIYDTAPLLAAGHTGAGQTVAVATFGGFDPADVAAFDTQNSLPAPTVNVIKVDGGALLGERNGQDESEADTEILHETVPGAAILVYEAPNTSDNSTMIDLFNRIVSDDRASVITTSWGSAESEYSSSDLNAIDQILQQAAAQGQAVFAASGDSGAYDDAGNSPSGDTTLAVDYPASSPWVTGVGGTSLVSTTPPYAGETAWSNPSNRAREGGGGGLSDVFARPAYQTGPGVSNGYSNGNRQVPDVSADADPATGYAVYTVNSSDQPTWGEMGGTSGAAPLWAGFAALVNSALGRQVGFMNPTLYRLGALQATFATPAFHDVTQGTNLYYPATAGWDFATGWGSFDGAAFVADLSTLPVPTSTPIPTATSTPRPTATPRPTSTPLPTPTAIPARITIQKIVLLHRVAGKLVPTTALKVGEQGTIEIVYSTSHAGSQRPAGTVALRQNGQTVKTVTLSPTTYNGQTALAATLKVTSKKWVGSLTAHATLQLGSVAAQVTGMFSLALG